MVLFSDISTPLYRNVSYSLHLLAHPAGYQKHRYEVRRQGREDYISTGFLLMREIWASFRPTLHPLYPIPHSNPFSSIFYDRSDAQICNRERFCYTSHHTLNDVGCQIPTTQTYQRALVKINF